MDHGTSDSLPREEHRRPDEVARDTIEQAPPLSQPAAVQHLREFTDFLASGLPAMQRAMRENLAKIDVSRALAVHHAVVEGLAEVRQWEKVEGEGR